MMMVAFSNTWTNNVDTRWCGCYNKDANKCVTHGKLYQWSAAMAGSTTEGAQGICPTGWHIPTSAEFITLYNTINSNINYRCNGIDGNIAKAIVSTSGWSSHPTVCI